MVTCLTRSTS
uniref:Uncharacterized protein n=1 Tax=Rhizophora mucronata TaxID=61149 RepID=A0A2P2QDC0_RHIMU